MNFKNWLVFLQLHSVEAKQYAAVLYSFERVVPVNTVGKWGGWCSSDAVYLTAVFKNLLTSPESPHSLIVGHYDCDTIRGGIVKRLSDAGTPRP